MGILAWQWVRAGSLENSRGERQSPPDRQIHKSSQDG